jgi:hypothetical protein
LILWQDDWRNYRPSKYEPDRIIVVGNKTSIQQQVRKFDIPKLCDELLTMDFYGAVDFYIAFKKFGDMYGHGWMNWTGQIFDAFKLIGAVIDG